MTVDDFLAKETPSKQRLLPQFLVGLVIGVFLAIVISCCASHCLKFIQVETHYRESQVIAEKSEKHYLTNETTTTPTGSDTKEVRVLCWIMTNRKHHKSRAQHIKRTWGRHCNKLIFMSSWNDEELGSVTITEGKNSRNSWLKAQAAVKYIYTYHLDEADWFFRGMRRRE